MEKKTHNCYDCKFKHEVPGSAHSCCHAIRAKFADPNDPRAVIAEVGIAFGAIKEVPGLLFPVNEIKNSIEINEHGKRNGWANWPFEFDPIWIDKCQMYNKK